MPEALSEKGGRQETVDSDKIGLPTGECTLAHRDAVSVYVLHALSHMNETSSKRTMIFAVSYNRKR